MLGRTMAVLSALVASAGASAQVTRHVAPCGNDAWMGVDPQCSGPGGPKRTIQAAIDASAAGDTVLVADGTYTGAGNRDLDFHGRDLVLRSRNGAAACIIDVAGADMHRGFRLQNGETRAARIEGFTITRGMSSGGSGMLLVGASPTVVGCVFKDNRPYEYGAFGAGVASEHGDPLFVACSFIANVAYSFSYGSGPGGVGGAVGVIGSATFRKCTFRGPWQEAGAYRGGALYARDATVVMHGCRIMSNKGALEGGALYCLNSTVTLTNCIVENNEASHAGAIYSSGSDLLIVRTRFQDNASLHAGGAIVSLGSLRMRSCRATRNSGRFYGGFIEAYGPLTLRDCLITRSEARGGGGVIDARYAPATIRGCTIAKNEGVSLWLSPSALVTNAIVTPASIMGEPVVRYSAAGPYPGEGNRRGNPLITWDYRLHPWSPCIDAGQNSDVTPGLGVDFYGQPRFRDDPWIPDVGSGSTPIVDIGALEFQGTSCRANCHMDGVLDAEDVACFHAAFVAGLPYGDWNRDGVWDSADYVAYNAAFAAGCP